ncbi:hypothetical protein M758_4G046400 [Ceratodon purpureus]|nr:hypothetical protein M758_4G046400 [Ceratodon purpureus]
MVRVTSALFPMDSTLCIIKPDAMRLGYKQNICHMIHMFGFNVVAEGTFKLTRVRAEQFYRAHAKMPYFETLIRFMIRCSSSLSLINTMSSGKHLLQYSHKSLNRLSSSFIFYGEHVR